MNIKLLLLNSTPVVTDPPGLYDYSFLIVLGLLFILALGQLHIFILISKGNQSKKLQTLRIVIGYLILLLFILLVFAAITRPPNLYLDE